LAIVKLKKLSIFGMTPDKDATLQKLQSLGGLHLIPLDKAAEEPGKISLIQADNAKNALKYLNQCAKKRHQVRQSNDFNLDEIASQVAHLQEKIRQLQDRRDFLLHRIQEIEPWGDFVLPKQGNIAGLKLWFYIVPLRMIKALPERQLIWKIVHQDNLHAYVVIVSESEPPAKIMPVPRTHTGTTPLSVLKNQLNQVEIDLEDAFAVRESLTRWIWLLTINLAQAIDQAELQHAKAITLDTQEIFVVQAWVPVQKIALYTDFAKQHQLAWLIEAASADETPPTLLQNSKQLAGGEDVVLFYQTPNYYAWDPSSMVFFSFALFFAMILSDAGYAVFFAVILAFKWLGLGATEKGRRFRLLAASTLAFSIVWGIFVGGYFGFSPAPHSLLGQLKILDINDFSAMMRLSILVGVLHIALANLVMAWQHRGQLNAYASLGWIAFVTGGFLLWYGMDTLNPNMQQTGYGFLATGMISQILFNSERQVHRASDWLWRVMDGMISLTRVTKIFGDVLSYMRLFALGLASSSLAITFNKLAFDVYHSASGAALLQCILILLVGHILNLMLCLMSGVVHGLRLNFIEFYNWSVSDEGYPFKAFSKTGD
jgi:V/A-type H+-transporting ATPase subunit I